MKMRRKFYSEKFLKIIIKNTKPYRLRAGALVLSLTSWPYENEFSTIIQSITTALKCKPILWKKFLHFVTEKNRWASSAMEKLQGNKVAPLMIGSTWKGGAILFRKKLKIKILFWKRFLFIKKEKGQFQGWNWKIPLRGKNACGMGIRWRECGYATGL